MMWKKTAVLAAILAALSTVVYWHEFSIKPKKEDELESKKMPFSLKNKMISEIFISDGKQSFTFKCLDIDKKLCKAGDSSKWQIIAPSTHNGDESNINALLSSITNVAALETFSLSEETLEARARMTKEYGLDPDSRSSGKFKKITATLSDGTKQTLHVGNVHPIGETFFTMMEQNENTVYLIPSHFKSNFEHDLVYWRNKRIFPLQTYEVSSFHLKAPKGTVQAEKKNGQWTLAGGLTGDIENIDNFLASTMNVLAKDFLSKSVVPNTAPLIELTLKKDSTTPLLVKLYKIKRMNTTTKKSEDRTILTLSGADPVYEVEGMQYERMNLGQRELRFSKLITSLERFAIKYIEFTGKSLGKEGLTATQVEGKWSVFNVKTKAIEDAISAILERLSGNRVQEFIATSMSPGADDLSLEIKLFEDAKQKPKRRLLIWKSKNTLYARDLDSERKETFKLDNLLDDALPWKKEKLTQ